MKKEKRKIVLFAIFACVVFATLATFLVVNAFGNQNSDAESEIYATEFDINSPNDVNVYVDTKVEFKNLFKIVPSNYNQGIEFDITPKSYLSSCSFNFENKTFSASQVGSYYIKFKVKTSKTSYKSETLKITVKPKTENLDLQQTVNSANVGQVFNFSDIFKSLTDANINSVEVENNSILGFSNNTFTAKIVGKTNIGIQIDRGYLTYFANFPFEVTQTSLPENKPEQEDKNNPNGNDQDENKDDNDQDVNSGSGNEKPTNPNDNVDEPPQHNEENQGDKDVENKGNQGTGDENNKPEDKDGNGEGSTDDETDNDKDDNKEEIKPNYEIKISNLNLTIGKNTIDFCLYKDNVQLAKQGIDVEILDDDGCVEYVDVDSPIIYIATIKQGKFKLKITSRFDSSISFIVEFNVI